MCLELQLEESVDDLMQQLGADAKGHISYAQFILCHKNLQLTPGQALYQVRFLKFVFIFYKLYKIHNFCHKNLTFGNK